jgi:hypothetical protein
VKGTAETGEGDNRPVSRAVTVLVLMALAVAATAWRLADVKPDPNVQAIADGCQRDTTKIYGPRAQLGICERPRLPRHGAAAGAALGHRNRLVP